MTAANNNTYEQVYYVNDDDGVMSRVAHVICVLTRRSLMVAGFNATRELLTMHYTGYSTNKPVWELDFFEHLFGNEPLLAAKEKVKGVFICSDKYLIVPEDLYDETEAKKWLSNIHFVETKDVVEAYPLLDDKAIYLLAAPVHITELIKINFKKAVALPLPVYHFTNAVAQSLYLQCCITGEQVCATLHNYSQLLWHRVFDYTCAEDIAYEIRLLCKENNISPDKVNMSCNTISAAEYNVVNGLSQYFPTIKAGNGISIGSQWDTAICLSQQLFACVL
jgi:hypothetical protein